MRSSMFLNLIILGVFFLAMRSECKPVTHPKQLKRPQSLSTHLHQPRGYHRGDKPHNFNYKPHHHHAHEANARDEEQAQRDKREYKESSANFGHGVTGPIHSFVKTDGGNYKWGVRHHIGPKYT